MKTERPSLITLDATSGLALAGRLAEQLHELSRRRMTGWSIRVAPIFCWSGWSVEKVAPRLYALPSSPELTFLNKK